MISVLALLMGIFLLPRASEGFNNFRYTYLRTGGKEMMRDDSDVFRQISKNEYIYVGSFNEVSKMAFYFSYEKFKKNELLSTWNRKNLINFFEINWRFFIEYRNL